MRTWLFSGSAALALCAATAAGASTVVLDFAGVANPNNTASVDGYYNGGTSSDGNSGTNFGVSFSSNALAINNYNGCCEPDSPTKGVLFFVSGPSVDINVAAGFDTGFSFFYSSANVSNVSVWSGADGTGTLLGTLPLAGQANSACPTGATGFYCTWTPVGVYFAGTAHSINFAGAANFVAFDDITFGSATAGGGVPEPATWALMIAGMGLAGGALRRRRSLAAVA